MIKENALTRSHAHTLEPLTLLNFPAFWAVLMLLQASLERGKYDQKRTHNCLRMYIRREASQSSHQHHHSLYEKYVCAWGQRTPLSSVCGRRVTYAKRALFGDGTDHGGNKASQVSSATQGDGRGKPARHLTAFILVFNSKNAPCLGREGTRERQAADT